MSYKATVLGIMSGSSLDGLDLCLANFYEENGRWRFKVLECQTVDLPQVLRQGLSQSANLDQLDLTKLDQDYGSFIGDAVNGLSTKTQIIGLHGHTVFHSPKDKISLQIGNSEVVASKTGIPTVGNFRMKDILLGGQGAPLVPLGEKYLFPEFHAFLNLGGICNATFRDSVDNWIAGDIGPFNQVFNFYASKLGRAYDDGGILAKSGNAIPALIERWNQFEFFSQPFPKSLGNAWVHENFLDLEERPQDVLASFAEFISTKIADQIIKFSPKKVLISGGGALNSFVIQKIKNKSTTEVVLPSSEIIEFKEALIFGFLGLLKSLNIPNVLSSCTGASEDSCSGDIYFP